MQDCLSNSDQFKDSDTQEDGIVLWFCLCKIGVLRKKKKKALPRGTTVFLIAKAHIPENCNLPKTGIIITIKKVPCENIKRGKVLRNTTWLYKLFEVNKQTKRTEHNKIVMLMHYS